MSSEEPSVAAASRPRARVRVFDVWAVANLLLLAGMSFYVYRKADYEFGLYAAVFMVAVGFAWWYLRRFEFPLWLLALVEIGILAHFAGGLIHFGPGNLRLYDHRYFDIRFDKWVHFYNSAVLATAITYIIDGAGVRLRRAKGFVVVLMMLGVGAVWEIVEYTAVMSLARTGVGDYHNNMRDLVANLAGSVSAATLGRWWSGRGPAGNV